MSERQQKIDRFAASLREAQAILGHGQRITGVHLFGIDHGRGLADMTVAECKEIAGKAGLKESLGTELHKGIRLSKFVKRL